MSLSLKDHQQKIIPCPSRFSPHFLVSEGFPALTRKKRSILFEESSDSLPVSLSGIILELKIAPFSTNRKAKLRSDQL
jgi:hypothetical protein